MPQLGRLVAVSPSSPCWCSPRRSSSRFYTDWLWFGEVGFRQVFTTILRTQRCCSSPASLAPLIWFAINLRIAVATMGDRRPSFVTREGLEVQLPGREQMQRLALAGMTRRRAS